MATHADISGNLAIGALQSVRRNSTNTAYEAFSTLSTGLVTTVILTGQGADIAQTGISNTTTPGMYRINFYLHATAVNVAADDITLKFYWFDGAGTSEKYYSPGVLPLMIYGQTTAQDSIVAYKTTGAISYSVTGGNYSTATYALYIVVEQIYTTAVLLLGNAAGTATVLGRMAGPILGIATGAATVTGRMAQTMCGTVAGTALVRGKLDE